ncbi:MAG: flagellar hook-associated protein FlgK [Proteobacteria bacterium]|nr:flagellar hook-associated protein FlgK [Pseudomonadota bacterium]
MSLSLALGGAVSGLRANQSAISLLTQNISNANSDGYTRQTVVQSQQVVAGMGAGVQIDQVMRSVDNILSAAARMQTSSTGAASAASDVLNRVQFYFGQPGSGNDIKSKMDDMFNTLLDLSNNSEQAFTRTLAVQKAVSFAGDVSELATNLQQARYDTDHEIADTVNEINNTLDDLNRVNESIRAATFNSTNKNALFDQRDKLLTKLQENISVSVTFDSDGQARIFNNQGDFLSESRYHLQYTPQSGPENFASDNPLSPIKMVLLDPNGNPIDTPTTSIVLVSGGTTGNITSKIDGGRLKGLLQARDQDLPNFLSQLDHFANTFRNAMNAIHNDGVGFPPANRLTGTRFVPGGEEHLWSGKVRFAALTENGLPVASPYPSEAKLRPYDMNFSTIQGPSGQGSATVRDIMRDFNSYFSPSNRVNSGNISDIKLGAISNSIATNGTFQFDLDLDNGSGSNSTVKVLSVTSNDPGVTFSATPAGLSTGVTVTAGSRLRTGTTNSITADFSGATLASPHVIQVQYDIDGQVSTVEYQVTDNVTDIRNTRYAATAVTSGTATLEIPTSFNPQLKMDLVDANGAVVTDPTASGYLRIQGLNTGYRVAMDELNSKEGGLPTDVSKATNSGFSSYFQLNDLFVSNGGVEKGSAQNLAVRQDIQNNKSLLSTGELTLSNSPDGSPVYTYQVGISSNANIKKLAAVQFQNFNFDSKGTLSGTSATLGGYVSELIGFAASTTEQANSVHDAEKLKSDGLQEKIDAIGGVNVDEELANSVLYQNAFGANARMISTINQLFESLLNLGQ